MKSAISVAPLVMSLMVLAAVPLRAQQAAPAAQPQAGGAFTWHSEVTVGTEYLAGDNHSSKFQEYRDIPNGLFLESLHVVGEHPRGGHVELAIGGLAQRDQEASITGGQWGRYSLFVTYDKIPHWISNDSALIFQQHGNVFTLPTAVKSAFQSTDTSTAAGKQAFSDLVNELAAPFPVRTERSTWAVGGRDDDGGPINYYLRFSDEHRTGNEPIGASFGFTNQLELPEPVDYHTRDLNAGVEYRTSRGAVQLGYWGQFFSNQFSSLTWDNPIQTTDAVDSSARGRLALPPDNSSHTLQVSGVYDLSPGSRLVGTFSGGIWRQDDALLPATINSALTVSPLPETSSHLQIDTLLGNVVLTSSLTDSLSFKAGWRRYRMKDKRPSLDFQQVIVDESLGEVADSGEHPSDFLTNNLNADFDYAVRRDLNLSLGWDRDTWHRADRDVAHTAENSWSVGANYLPSALLALRAYYRLSDKNIGPYVGDVSQLPLLRKYDEAARNRHEVGFVIQLTPNEQWQADLSVNSIHNDYDESAFGLQSDNSSDISLDLAYALSSRTSAYAGASRERNHTHLHSRYRPFDSATATAIDDPLNDWDSFERDHDMTYWVGASHDFVPGVWSGDLTISFTDGRGAVDAFGVPGGVSQGAAQAWPETRFKYLTLEAMAYRRVKNNLKLRFGYRFERYSESDFALDLMQPYMGFVDSSSATSVYLGAREPSYTAHIVSVALQTGF